ncbi:MAG: translocation/assembly module TamB domain-containing protein, partial [Chitinophagaceae bacterium]
RAKYDLAIRTDNFDLGTLLQNKANFGTLTARLTAKGRGYAMKTANASIAGVIESVVLKKYNYRNLVLDAGIASQQLRAKAEIHDPNIDFAINASGNMSGKYPAITMTAKIDSIKTIPLHLTQDSIIYRGVITANFPITDPDNLRGDLLVTNSLLIKGNQRLQLDTVQLSSGSSDKGQFLRVSADAINIALEGRYKLTQLGDVFTQAINPYWEISSDSLKKKIDPYNFTFNGNVINKPLLTAFLPNLKRLDPVSMNGRFSSDSGFTFNVSAPKVVYADNEITDLQIKANTEKDSLHADINIGKARSGKSLALFNSSMSTVLAGNQVDFTLNLKDSLTKDKYRFSALFKQLKPGDYQFSIKPGQVLLNYDDWSIPQDNLISILKTDIHARNFILSQGKQQLSINSQGQEVNAPMEVAFSNFKIATLANFVVSDSLPVDGTLDGKAVLQNLTSSPTFTSDLTISEVAFRKDTIGNVHILVNNTVKDTYAANVTIKGHENDVELTGNYYVRPDSNSSFDLNLDIRRIFLNTVEGLTMGAIKNASGYLTGKFAVNGKVSAPSVDGNLDFKNTAFNLSMLNSYFKIDNESIKIGNEGIRFSTFTIKDSSNNAAVLDGMVYYNPGYTDYRFDLTLKADNFRALNTTKVNSKVYYGKLFFNSNLRIKGTQLNPVVDGSIAINDDTKLTVVLPQKEPGIEARAGIVEFVDMDAIPNDSLFMAKYDSVNKSDVMGMDIAVNINISKKAEFNLIVDESSGDYLTVQGSAALSGGIDPSGKITLAGSYELESGAYELSFNFLHRRFDIQKGSTIVWTGEPTKANINITATYLAKTAPLDLVSAQLTGVENTEAAKNYYRQKLPFNVNLIMKGELLKPQLSFDIVLPPDKNYNLDKTKINTIETKLGVIRQEPSELNKQVFALLLLGRFVTENPFASSSGGFSAEGFARNSVSQLLTEQLNNLASDLVQGVDINFDVASTTDDYTSGEKAKRTDLNVALSKRLLNDRLTVTIGSNFELENTQSSSTGKQRTNNLAGNVSIDYKLSKDGKYAIRAYRKNQYEGIVEGYVVETGVGFVISLEYNRFSQIFLSKKQKEQKREMRKEERESKKEADNQPIDSTGKSMIDERRKDTPPTNKDNEKN